MRGYNVRFHGQNSVLKLSPIHIPVGTAGLQERGELRTLTPESEKKVIQ